MSPSSSYQRRDGGGKEQRSDSGGSLEPNLTPLSLRSFLTFNYLHLYDCNFFFENAYARGPSSQI